MFKCSLITKLLSLVNYSELFSPFTFLVDFNVEIYLTMVFSQCGQFNPICSLWSCEPALWWIFPPYISDYSRMHAHISTRVESCSTRSKCQRQRGVLWAGLALPPAHMPHSPLSWKDMLFPEILETISKSAHRAMRGERGSERTSMCDSSQADIVEMSWPFCCCCWWLLSSLDFRRRRWWRQLRHEKWWMITVESVFGPKKVRARSHEERRVEDWFFSFFFAASQPALSLSFSTSKSMVGF